MISFNVTVTAPAHLDADMTYTNASMKEGESKFEMMARYTDFHREVWGIEDGVELVTTASTASRSA